MSPLLCKAQACVVRIRPPLPSSTGRGAPARVQWWAAVVLLVSLASSGVVAACAPSTPAVVALGDAGTARIVTLTGTRDGVLIGRHDTAAHPRASLQLLETGGRVRDVPLVSGSQDYGNEAQLEFVDARDGDVVAVGGVRSGAHSNVRWAVYRGGLASVVEQPQAFETFGGWGAGTLAGVAVSPSGALILGSWSNETASALDVTTWEQRGAAWVRSVVRVRRASATELPSPGAITAADSGYAAVGWVTVLGAALLDNPVLWFTDASRGHWTEASLPHPEGAHSVHPTAVACQAGTCVVAARSDASVMVWAVELNSSHPRVGDPVTITAEPAGAGDKLLVTAQQAGGAVAFTAGQDSRLVRVQNGRASAAVTLTGTLVGLAAAPAGELVLATADGQGGTRLWQSTVAASPPR